MRREVRPEGRPDLFKSVDALDPDNGDLLTQKHIPNAIPTNDKAFPLVSGVVTSERMALQKRV